MSKVAELQAIFQHAVLANNLTPGLFVNEGQVENGGFDLYLNAYRARLRAALKDNYPVLFLALGDDAFEELGTLFLTQQPSRFRSIRWFGEGLRAFLDRYPDALPHPALADLASMDWALRGAFDAADADVLQVADLSAVAPEHWPDMRFNLHPSVTLLDLSWRVEPIWHALSEDAHAQTDEPETFEHTLLVWRQALECKWRSIGKAEALGLRALANGDSFAQLCEALEVSEATADPTNFVASLMNQWLNDGLIARDATFGHVISSYKT